MKIVYIAGPYYGDGRKATIEKNIREAEKYQIVLANHGIGFFCSHNHTEHFQEKATAPESFYYKLDFQILKSVADAILAIPGWRDSKGSAEEVKWAKAKGIPVFYAASPEKIQELLNWAKEIKIVERSTL